VSGELSPEAQALFEKARAGRLPTAADRARVREALRARLEAPQPAVQPAGKPHSTMPPPVAAGFGGKILVAGAVVTALGLGAWWYAHSRSHVSPARANHTVATSAPPEILPRVPLGTPVTVPVAPAPPVAPVLAPPRVPSEPLAVRHATHAMRVREPSNTVATEPPAVVPSPAPEHASSDTWQAEYELQRNARRAAPADALRLLDEYATRFPSGVFREEMHAQRIVVLCTLGRIDEAREAMQRFFAEWPHSVYAPRVRSSCASSGH
jgi:hypothetical protein